MTNPVTTAYDTQVLLGVIRTLFTPSTYWLDQFFPDTQTFEQEYIDFDRLVGGRRMAPFVAPTAQGKPLMAQGYRTTRFKPAYVKPKDIIDPQRIIKRRAGEALNGSLSLQARRDAVVADILLEHKAQIIRRLEWMACQAVVNGSVLVSGDDYPATNVDFGRNPEQTIVNSGTSLWSDQVNSNPLDDIETWQIQFQQLTGFVPDRLTMGLSAWRSYRTHPKVLAQLNMLLRGTIDSFQGSALTGSSAQYVGKVGLGQLDIFVYNDLYEDKTSAPGALVLVPFLDPTLCVMTSAAGIAGLRCFGAILDARAGYTATDFFPKQWQEEDPSVEFLMTQSAPLMVPSRPDCSLSAKVV